jgi:hypothetical protein
LDGSAAGIIEPSFAWLGRFRLRDIAAIFEAAYDRHPASRELVDWLFKHYRAVAGGSDDLQARRAAIARLGSIAERFARHCIREDYETARALVREVDALSSQLVELAERRQ